MQFRSDYLAYEIDWNRPREQGLEVFEFYTGPWLYVATAPACWKHIFRYLVHSAPALRRSSSNERPFLKYNWKAEIWNILFVTGMLPAHSLALSCYRIRFK